MINIMAKIWAKLVQNGKLKENSQFIKEITSKEKPEWVHSKDYKTCPHYFIWNELKTWSKRYGNKYTFYPIVDLLENIYMYRVRDFSVSNKLLLNDRFKLTNKLDKRAKDVKIAFKKARDLSNDHLFLEENDHLFLEEDDHLFWEKDDI